MTTEINILIDTEIKKYKDKTGDPTPAIKINIFVLIWQTLII
jgi:hypothetical protein